MSKKYNPTAAENFYGPPQASPFDGFTPEQHAKWEQALKVADGIQLYRTAGKTGAGAQWKPFADDLDRAGGLTEEAALNLARYKMWKQGMPVPQTPYVAPTPGQVAARREQLMATFAANDPKARAKMFDEDERQIFESQQDLYKPLVKPKPQQAPANEVTDSKITLAKRPEYE